jgi:hypothetical protein
MTIIQIFYMELKSASSKSSSEVTKFNVKIDLFTKFFDLLPRGSYAVCDIPLTYWLLIYREFWDIIIDCISNGGSFPYDKINEIRTVSTLEGLDLNQISDENEEYRRLLMKKSKNLMRKLRIKENYISFFCNKFFQ